MAASSGSSAVSSALLMKEYRGESSVLTPARLASAVCHCAESGQQPLRVRRSLCALQEWAGIVANVASDLLSLDTPFRPGMDVRGLPALSLLLFRSRWIDSD